jgi:asparagine synthase (glutamine-hydrolysing)
MCGIFGFVNAAPGPRTTRASVVEAGLDAIRHRGPDGQGVWVSDDGRVGMGHVRLTIIDLETGQQPMLGEGGFVIVYNGEVYNFIELRQELGADSFRTQSDTEVILRAYQRWGADCVTRLRGMFAFSIWDPRREQLFVARDRFGIKPLYLAQTPHGTVFGSEVKALAPLLSERRVNAAALSDYFSFQFCLGAKTMLDGVVQVPPAHCGYIEPSKAPKLDRYWEVHYNLDFDHSERWFIERLRELTEDSVRMHRRADVEIGAYVSGGVDSSLLAILARDQARDGPFQIFNGRFVEGLAFDESRFAADVSAQHDMRLHVADITEDDFVDSIAQVIWHLDQPTAGPGSFPQYMVSRQVSQHVKVVLGGQGGDEIFGGYARYLVAYFEQCIKGAIEGTLHDGNFIVTYESIIPNLRTLEQYKPMIREFWADGVFEERDLRYFRLVNRANTFGDLLMPGTVNRSAALEQFQEIFWGGNVGKEAYFDSMTHFDFKTLLPALLQVEDRMSMAHGVESRVPFLDHPLVEFAATVPPDVKFRNGELKRMLRLGFSDRLPQSIQQRKDKMGFPVPLTQWLKRGGRAADFVRDLLSSSSARTRPYLSAPIDVDRILDSQSAYGRNLWALIGLELWHKAFIDGTHITRPK